jgi:hypothetical protein
MSPELDHKSNWEVEGESPMEVVVGGLKRDLNPPFIRWKFEIKRWVFVCWLAKKNEPPQVRR